MSDSRMNAHHYRFEPTGVKEVDEILSMIAWAGTAARNTSHWNDVCEYYGPSKDVKNGKTPVDWIQNAANRAAMKFERMG